MVKKHTVDYDKYGWCCQCHTRLMTEKFIDGEWQAIWMPTAKERTVLLNNGSKMRIMMCSDCYNKFDERAFNKVMDSVIKGWDKETDELVANPSFPGWNKDTKKSYMNKYSKLKIVCDVENDSKDVLDKRLKEFKYREIQNGICK